MAIQITEALAAAHDQRHHPQRHQAGQHQDHARPAPSRCSTSGWQRISNAPKPVPPSSRGASDVRRSCRAQGRCLVRWPTCLRNRPEVNPSMRRTDLFSLGAVLYEMVTGRSAFGGAESSRRPEAILHAALKSPRVVNPAVPHALERVIVRLMQPSREARYQTAAAVRGDLVKLNTGLSAGSLWLRHRPALIVGTAITVVVGVGALMWPYSPRGDPVRGKYTADHPLRRLRNFAGPLSGRASADVHPRRQHIRRRRTDLSESASGRRAGATDLRQRGKDRVRSFPRTVHVSRIPHTRALSGTRGLFQLQTERPVSGLGTPRGSRGRAIVCCSRKSPPVFI